MIATRSIKWRGAEVTRDVMTGVKRAMAEAGRLGIREAKIRVPVRTGRLRHSIRAKLSVGRSSTKLTLIADAAVGGRESYASFVEYGTSRMSPRPYLKPGADRMTGSLERLLRKHIGRG